MSKQMTPEVFETHVRLHCASLGLFVHSVISRRADLGCGLADSAVLVAMTDRKEAHRVSLKLERILRRAIDSHIRIGYYDAESGYDVPVGQALFGMDCHTLAFPGVTVR